MSIVCMHILYVATSVLVLAYYVATQYIHVITNNTANTYCIHNTYVVLATQYYCTVRLYWPAANNCTLLICQYHCQPYQLLEQCSYVAMYIYILILGYTYQYYIRQRHIVRTVLHRTSSIATAILHMWLHTAYALTSIHDSCPMPPLPRMTLFKILYKQVFVSFFYVYFSYILNNQLVSHCQKALSSKGHTRCMDRRGLHGAIVHDSSMQQYSICSSVVVAISIIDYNIVFTSTTRSTINSYDCVTPCPPCIYTIYSMYVLCKYVLLLLLLAMQHTYTICMYTYVKYYRQYVHYI